MKEWRCKHCTHGQRCTAQNGIVMWYCTAHHRYCPSPSFVEAWGCNEYENTQLDLFEERREDK